MTAVASVREIGKSTSKTGTVFGLDTFGLWYELKINHVDLLNWEYLDKAAQHC